MRNSLRIYRREWLRLALLAVAVFVPAAAVAAVLEALTGAITPQRGAGDDIALAFLSVAVLASAVTSTVGQQVYSGIVGDVIAEDFTEGRRRAFWHLARTLPYGRLIIIDIVYSALFAIGLVLLIVPGVIFATWFALSAPLVSIEGSGVIASMRRSRALVRHNFAPVLAVAAFTIIGADLLAAALDALATFVPSEVGTAIVAAFLSAVIVAPLGGLGIVVTAHQLIERETLAQVDPCGVVVIVNEVTRAEPIALAIAQHLNGKSLKLDDSPQDASRQIDAAQDPAALAAVLVPEQLVDDAGIRRRISNATLVVWLRNPDSTYRLMCREIADVVIDPAADPAQTVEVVLARL